MMQQNLPFFHPGSNKHLFIFGIQKDKVPVVRFGSKRRIVEFSRQCLKKELQVCPTTNRETVDGCFPSLVLFVIATTQKSFHTI